MAEAAFGEKEAAHQFPPPPTPPAPDHHSPLPPTSSSAPAIDSDGGNVAVDEFSVLKNAIGMGLKPSDVDDDEEAPPPPPFTTHHTAQSPSSNYAQTIPQSNASSHIPLIASRGYSTDQHCPPGRPSSTNHSHSEGGDAFHSRNVDVNDDGPFSTEIKGVVGKTRPRAVLRVERDFTAVGATTGRVQFWDGWIEELEGRITPLQFQNTLNEINSVLDSAYDPYKSIVDNILSVLTLYMSPYTFGTHYKKEMKKFEMILARENKSIYNPVGLHLVHPRKVGFLFLEIEYY